MTQVRTPETMKASGVSEAGVALTVRLIDLLDSEWTTRESFVQHVQKKHPLRKLSKQRLSKELGSKAKPLGAEWCIAELIVDECVAERMRASVKAEVAGLWCQARGSLGIPGYQGEILHPANDDGSLRAKLAQAESELIEQCGELEHFRLRVVTLEQEKVILEKRLEEIEARQTQDRQDLTVTRARLAITERQATGLERANARLKRQIGNHSPVEPWPFVNDQHAGATAAQIELREQRIRAISAERRLDDLRETHARYVTEVQLRRKWLPTFPGKAVHRSGLVLAKDVDSRAPIELRRLVLYLLAHQGQTEPHLGRVARQTQLPLVQVKLILTARSMPSPTEVDMIALAMGACVGTARHLHAAALSACRHHPILGQPSGTFPPDLSGFGGDTGEATPRSSPAAVPLSTGDNDSPVAEMGYKPFTASRTNATLSPPVAVEETRPAAARRGDTDKHSVTPTLGRSWSTIRENRLVVALLLGVLSAALGIDLFSLGATMALSPASTSSTVEVVRGTGPAGFALCMLLGTAAVGSLAAFLYASRCQLQHMWARRIDSFEVDQPLTNWQPPRSRPAWISPPQEASSVHDGNSRIGGGSLLTSAFRPRVPAPSSRGWK